MVDQITSIKELCPIPAKGAQAEHNAVEAHDSANAGAIIRIICAGADTAALNGGGDLQRVGVLVPHDFCLEIDKFEHSGRDQKSPQPYRPQLPKVP